MCDMICLKALSDRTNTMTVHIPFKIARNNNNKNVLTKREGKDYKIACKGRRIVNNFHTLHCAF